MSNNPLTLTIDGQEISVPPETTLWEAAQQLGIEIPALCHEPRMDPVGVCRLCVVDVGERTLTASCMRACEPGMQVLTQSPELEQHRRILTLLLLSEQPEQSAREATTGDDELYALARRYAISDIPLPDGAESYPRGADTSSLVIAVDHQACILCDRCIRGCNQLQHNNVITRTGKGYGTRIAFDLDVPMGKSTCVACGECAAVCPTGALTHKALQGLQMEPVGGGET